MVFYEQAVLDPRKNKFITKDSPLYPLNIGYSDEYIEEGTNANCMAYKLIII
jgi:hypothetical protein